MPRISLKSRIIEELENLISSSCENGPITKSAEELHIEVLKIHYNALYVSIDYHRKRVSMDIILDSRPVTEDAVCQLIPTLHANLLYNDLTEFLRSCIDSDTSKIGQYARLIRDYTQEELPLIVV